MNILYVNLEKRLGPNMKQEIQAFIDYIHNVKKSSHNTEASYKRDLIKMAEFFEGQGITDVRRINSTNVNSYVLYLEKNNMSSSTISRSIASMRAFFHFELSEGKIDREPTELVKTPKTRKKAPSVLTVDEVERFLKVINGKDEKSIRDKAMLELLYASGMRVSEIISLKLSDVNMQLGYIVCRSETTGRERVIPFGNTTKQCLNKYLKSERSKIVSDQDTEWLFVNCFGRKLSRQGYWKVLKGYAEKANINKEVTPHTLRHSFAAHMVQNGADLKSVQEMMGHADISSTQIYAQLTNSRLREVYAKAHPHG